MTTGSPEVVFSLDGGEVYNVDSNFLAIQCGRLLIEVMN